MIYSGFAAKLSKYGGLLSVKIIGKEFKVNQMAHQELSLIYTTIAPLAEAKTLARQAVEAKLAFCVNIMPEGISVYRWEGKTYEEGECFMLFKTSQKMRGQLVTWLEKNHPYTVPVIMEADVMANSAYVQSMMPEAIE